MVFCEVLGLAIILFLIFGGFYVWALFRRYDEEDVEEFAYGVVIAAAVIFLICVLLANVEVSRQNLLNRIAEMQEVEE